MFKKILSSIIRNQKYFRILACILLVIFVIAFWIIFCQNQLIILKSEDSSIWIAISALILFVCFQTIRMNIFQEKIFKDIEDIFTQIVDTEHNFVEMSRDLKNDIAKLLYCIRKYGGEDNGKAEEYFEQETRKVVDEEFSSK